jgi:hypothetical protein
MKTSIKQILSAGLFLLGLGTVTAAPLSGSGNDPDGRNGFNQLVIQYLNNHGYHAVTITSNLDAKGDVIVFSDRRRHTVVHTKAPINGHEDMPYAADITGHEDLPQITGFEDLPQITGLEDLPY